MTQHKALCNRFGYLTTLGTAIVGVPAITLAFNQFAAPLMKTSTIDPAQIPFLMTVGFYSWGSGILGEMAADMYLRTKKHGPTKSSSIAQKAQISSFGLFYCTLSTMALS